MGTPKVSQASCNFFMLAPEWKFRGPEYGNILDTRPHRKIIHANHSQNRKSPSVSLLYYNFKGYDLKMSYMHLFNSTISKRSEDYFGPFGSAQVMYTYPTVRWKSGFTSQAQEQEPAV